MYPNFLSKDCPKTLIFFGVSDSTLKLESNVLANSGLWHDALKLNSVILSPKSPSLRLNSKGWININSQVLSKVRLTNDLFETCRKRLLQNIDNFSINLNKFLSAYMDFVTELIEINEHEIKNNIQGKEFYNYKDFVFSSWLPLPNSRILLPSNFNEKNTNDLYFAHLDIAFWVNGEIIGVNIGSKAPGIKSKHETLEFLKTNYPGIKIINLETSELTQGNFPIEKFPKKFGKFWQNVYAPQGPDAPEFISK